MKFCPTLSSLETRENPAFPVPIGMIMTAYYNSVEVDILPFVDGGRNPQDSTVPPITTEDPATGSPLGTGPYGGNPIMPTLPTQPTGPNGLPYDPYIPTGPIGL